MVITTVYLIRHCEADGNIKEIFQGHTDGGITEKGERQLEMLSERCKDLNPDIIFSSPLTRAYKTAQAAGKYHDVPIIREKGIIEINGGDMEGKMWSELPILFPEDFPVWKNNFPAFSAPNGESVKNVYERMKLTVLKHVSENIGKTLVFATHGGAIYTFLAYAYGIPFEECGGKNLWCENTSLTRVDFTHENGDFKPDVIYMNDFCHLSGDTLPHQMFWRKEKQLTEPS